MQSLHATSEMLKQSRDGGDERKTKAEGVCLTAGQMVSASGERKVFTVCSERADKHKKRICVCNERARKIISPLAKAARVTQVCLEGFFSLLSYSVLSDPFTLTA